MMTGDDVSLDQMSMQSSHDLIKLLNDDIADDDINDSPYSMVNNACDYYQPNEVRQLLDHEKISLSIFCLNCQGLKAHWDAFCNLTDEMNNENCTGSFDVIGITELFHMSKGEYTLNNYHAFEFKTRNDTLTARGGIGMFIKENLQYNIRDDLSIFIPNIFESIFAEIYINRKPILIGTIYRPNTPPKADMDIFMKTKDLQNTLAKENKESYIMGDINIDLLKFPHHSKTNEYLENIFSQGHIPLITKPTRVTDHSATLIDHIYANKLQITTTSGIVVTDVSDHFGIFTIIKSLSTKTSSLNEVNCFRSFKQENINIFKEKLKTIDFTPVMELQCVNASYNKFMELYMDAYITLHFPSKIKKFKINIGNNHPGSQRV